MSGGSKQTSTTSQKETVGPWAPSQPALQDILGQAQGLLGGAGINPVENAALSGLAANAQNMQGYAPQLHGFTDPLCAGGGYGAGVPGVNQAWQTAQGALTPIATGNLDPMQNPYTQGIIDKIKNQVGAEFADAGRSFSGAHAGALGSSLAPALFNQYNQNVQNAMGASQGLLSGAQGTSGALDSAAGNRLGAMSAAPGSLSNLNAPQLAMLQAEAARRGLPVQNLSDINSLILPIAQLGREGTSSGTSVQQQKSNPTQTAVGAGLGILGTLGQVAPFLPFL